MFQKRWIAMCLCILFLATGCSSSKSTDVPALTDASVMHEEEFGGVYVDMTIEDFNALGFAYGDCVTVSFSNGYTVEKIPYYNGYYTATGETLLVAYPGYPYIKVCINNGDDLWNLAGLTEADKADIVRVEQGAFLANQEARDIHYVDDRAEFDSDAEFANFRYVKAGAIQEATLYRSASPCDNQHNRAPYVDKLIAAAGVSYILDLADTDEKIQGYIESDDFDSPYFLSLYEAGKDAPIALNMNYGDESFRQKLVSGLLQMSENPGPYLVHCTEGKDRTGFVCMLLEAVCGASYEEMVDDYMITYDNYYGITEESDPTKYHTIIDNLLQPMIEAVTGEDADLTTINYAEAAEAYLLNAGMTEDQIAALRTNLCGK